VGMVAAACLADAGHRVLGVDIDSDRIAQLRAGRLPFYEPGLPDLFGSSLGEGRLRFEHRDLVAEPLGDVTIVATGTPQTANGAADLSQVRSALNWIRSQDHADTVVVMKSTVPPGTGQRVVEQEMRNAERAAVGLRYVSNPEFLREGQAVRDWQHPDRIVIGADAGDGKSVAAVQAMHAGVDAPYIVTDITSAEMIKYASNAFLATRISFINEIASLCERVGASIDAVSDGMAMDPRTGGRIYAGVGYGGSCFPKDVRALDNVALTSGVNVELLRSVININNRQRLLPVYALRERFSGGMDGLRVGVLGLAFKPNTDDVREAPSLDMINTLCDDGAIVSAYDPEAMDTARPHLPASVRLVDNVLEAANQAQAIVLVTEWSEFVDANWRDIARCMNPPRFLFDGRNALDGPKMQRLGFQYTGVGRNANGPGLAQAV
jgi:UDPglucose 6-dehydrogenase